MHEYHFTQDLDHWMGSQNRVAWPWGLFYHLKQDNLIEMSSKYMTAQSRIEINLFIKIMPFCCKAI